MVDKLEIANMLREAGMLLGIAGDNQYKARAYFNGASSLESLTENIDRVISENRLTDLPGIGKSLAANIHEIYETGELALLKELKEQLPAGVVELSQVPGLTLKRIQALSDALSVSSVDELEQACREHRVRQVEGFGAKTEESVLQNIGTYRKRLKKMLLLHARKTSWQILEYLKSALKSERVEVAGEIRRWHEVVDSVRIVAEGSSRSLQDFERFPLITEITESSDRGRSARLTDGKDVRFTVGKCLATALLFETGSQEHVAGLMAIAHTRGLSLEFDGLMENGQPLDIESEAEIYNLLGLAYVPPELREGCGEIEYAKQNDYDDLVKIEDIKGMTHCHTTYSDGVASVEEMAVAAQRLGMQYLTITDHSPAAHYAGGLSIDTLKRQWEEISRVQERVDIKLLKGTESDILANGDLDYPDHILQQFDVIIASVHSRFKLDSASMTDRLVRCMKNRHFKIWGHPLGRLLLRREPIQCDVEKVLDVIAESKAAIEINASPHRLDMEPTWLREARKRGIPFVISTDAHSTREYGSLRYGVHQARRAGITRAEVLNTYELKRFAKLVRP